jgi:hypothetical protein
VSEFIFVIVFVLVLSPLYIPIIVIGVCVVQTVHWWRASLEDANSAINRLRTASAINRLRTASAINRLRAPLASRAS